MAGAAGHHPGLGVALAALGAVGFSFKAILVKLAYPFGVDTITLLALRMLLSVPFFLWVTFRPGASATPTPLSSKDQLHIGTLGIVGYYGASYLDFLGLHHISAGLERLILFLYPTLVVVISWLALGKRLQRRDALALLVCYAGIGLAFAHDLGSSPAGGETWLGGGLVFASALAYAIYLIGNGQMVTRIGAARFTALAMTWASLACILQFVCTHPLSALVLPWQVYVLGAVMATVSTVLPTFLVSNAIRAIGSARTALVGSVGPPVTILLGWWLLHEPISTEQLIGGALVMIGVMLVSR